MYFERVKRPIQNNCYGIFRARVDLGKGPSLNYRILLVLKTRSVKRLNIYTEGERRDLGLLAVSSKTRWVLGCDI